MYVKQIKWMKKIVAFNSKPINIHRKSITVGWLHTVNGHAQNRVRKCWWSKLAKYVRNYGDLLLFFSLDFNLRKKLKRNARISRSLFLLFVVLCFFFHMTRSRQKSMNGNTALTHVLICPRLICNPKMANEQKRKRLNKNYQ